MDLHGTVNHVALTVSDLDSAMQFLSPILKALGYTVGEPMSYGESRLTVNVHNGHGTAINLWESTQPHRFHPYEPGLHHVALNVSSRASVDHIRDLAARAGARILDGPGEFPFAHNGYYAVYFLGPDEIKFEIVHMDGLRDAVTRGEASLA